MYYTSRKSVPNAAIYANKFERRDRKNSGEEDRTTNEKGDERKRSQNTEENSTIMRFDLCSSALLGAETSLTVKFA